MMTAPTSQSTPANRPRNGHQQGHLGAVGQQSFADPRVEGGNIGFDRLDAAELHREQKAVMLFDAAGEGLDQLGALAAQLASGEGRHLLGSGAAGNKRLQHGPPGDAEYLAHHARQLDVGGLQQPQQTVAFRRLGLDEFAAIAHQLAQLAQWRGRHKAPGDQPMADQIGRASCRERVFEAV